MIWKISKKLTREQKIFWKCIGFDFLKFCLHVIIQGFLKAINNTYYHTSNNIIII